MLPSGSGVLGFPRYKPSPSTAAGPSLSKLITAAFLRSVPVVARPATGRREAYGFRNLRVKNFENYRLRVRLLCGG